jgi:chromosome partitioning protein
MARYILFTSQKGGVGKSILARSTAVALASAGRKVLLVDFDKQQRTCLHWQAQRQARGLQPGIAVAEVSKPTKLRRIAQDYEDVVMDTRGQQDPASLALARLSDVVFLPSSFSLDDIQPTLALIESLREAGVAPSRLAVVFCRTGGSARQERQARSIFAMNDITALEPKLPHRDGFASLSAIGRTGRESPNALLRSIAIALEQALLQFMDAADTRSDGTSLSRPAGRDAAQ